MNEDNKDDDKLEEADNDSIIEESEVDTDDSEDENRKDLSHEEVLLAKKLTVKDIREHISGPVVSLVLHIIVIAFLSSIIVFEAPQERAEIEIKEVQLDIKNVEPIPEPPEQEEIESEDELEIERPDVTTENTEVTVENINVDVASVDIVMPEVLAVKPTNSALVMPALFSMRSTGGGRKSALKRYGGSINTEKAVLKGLQWLADNQNPDGSWGEFKQSQYAFTALATLAFFGHGETPSSPKYGITLIKAIKKMLEWAKKYKHVGGGRTYSHPIVAYALAEAYGITRMQKVKEAMDKTMKPIIDNINKRGSYNYYYDRVPRILQRDRVTGKMPKGVEPEPICDLSYAGWNYQALKAAFTAGCELKGLDEAINLSIDGLYHHTKKHKKHGGFGIFPRSKPDFGMTSVGILCLGLLGEGNGDAAKKAIKWMKTFNKNGIKTCSWKYNEEIYKEYPKAFTHAIYTWYYLTQVIFQASKGKGNLWRKWNNAFSKAYVKEQNKDGSWSTPAEKYGYNKLDSNKVNAEWRQVPHFKAEKDLKIYSTALCCLTLEVYYRYLPTYKLVVKKNKVLLKGDDDDDDLGMVLE